jgi:hypothetical protein
MTSSGRASVRRMGELLKQFDGRGEPPSHRPTCDGGGDGYGGGDVWGHWGTYYGRTSDFLGIGALLH